MFKSISRARVLFAVMVLGMASDLSGCGSSGASPAIQPPLVNVVTGGGTGGGNVNCANPVAGPDDITLCKHTSSLINGPVPIGGSNFVYQLSESSTYNSLVISSLVLQPNDQITVAAQGGYFATHSSFFTYSCDDTDLGGHGTNGSFPKGLIGEVGGAYFNIGDGTTFTVPAGGVAGSLHLGINLGYSPTFACATGIITQLTLSRCTDTSGNSYPCP